MKNIFSLIAGFIGIGIIFGVVGFVLSIYKISPFDLICFVLSGISLIAFVVSIIVGYKKIKK